MLTPNMLSTVPNVILTERDKILIALYENRKKLLQ